MAVDDGSIRGYEHERAIHDFRVSEDRRDD